LGLAVDSRACEIPAVAWSFGYFFYLLCSYYILRPLRDEMGIAGGVDRLQWLFAGTFVVMLAAVPAFGWLSSRLPRRQLIPVVYGLFIAHILGFYVWFDAAGETAWAARTFFIWTSVFNLFVVSVFWSFMADLYNNEQARRLFGFIAAGGSAGAIAGPALTTLLAPLMGPVHLLPVSAGLLAVAVVCIHRLSAWSKRPDARAGASGPLGGSAFDAIPLVLSSRYLLGICVFIWLYTTLATFVYFTQAQIIADHLDAPAQRTQLFAAMDLAVNTLTLLTQALLTGRIIRALGLSWTLAAIPLLVMLGLFGLALAPVLPALILFQVLRRAGNYAITRPAREVLFTVVGRKARYKAKNLIDTVIYRGGDALSGWLFVALKTLGLGLAGIALAAIPLALAWLLTGLWLGRRQEALRRAQQPNTTRRGPRGPPVQP
jgi:AAA family ATP:ADP antiporter